MLQSQHLALLAFERPVAKPDYITIQARTETHDAIAPLIKDGNIAEPHYKARSDPWITVHNPSTADLQRLINFDHSLRIIGLEIAVDFTPSSTANALAQCRQLHAWFVHTLFPAKHPSMGARTTRWRYSTTVRKYLRDGLTTPSNGGFTSVLWRHQRGAFQLRCYIKEHDAHTALQRPCVRVEVTLLRAGCQDLQVHQLGLLPHFVGGLRRNLQPFFHVARSIKPVERRVRGSKQERVRRRLAEIDSTNAHRERNWRRYGAQWANKHGLEVQPDASANRAIGGALKALQNRLARLKLPEKVADSENYVSEAIDSIAVFRGPKPVYRSCALNDHLIHLLKQHPCYSSALRT